MYAFTECHMCKAGASRVRRYLREHDYSNVAYTSKTMASIEVESPTLALARSLASGVILLLTS